MSVYIDRKYLLLVSSLLQRFSQKKEDLFNFRCPICGDSQKNKLKARGYVYRKNNDYFYTCHNCLASTTFSKFLKNVDPETHRRYTLERYTSGDNAHSNYKKHEFSLSGPKPSEILNNKKLRLKDIKIDSIDKLPSNHPAVEYIRGRKIPQEYWSEIFYHTEYKNFIDSAFPEHSTDDIPNDSRIVLFYTNEKSEITNVTGRAINPTKVRYCTVKVSDEKKLFGLHRLQKENTIYVLEGQFDSFFIPNSVASGDSNLGGAAAALSESDVVLIYDNEPRNKEIVKQIGRSIENNFKVVLFPDILPYKDINEMVLGGMSSEEILKIIDDNTSQGLTAKLKFVDWKKV